MLAVERLAHLRVGLSVVRGGAAWVGTTLLILLNLIVILKIVTSWWISRNPVNLIEMWPRRYPWYLHDNPRLQLLIEYIIYLTLQFSWVLCWWPTHSPRDAVWHIWRCSDSILSESHLRLRIRIKESLFLICDVLFRRWSAIRVFCTTFIDTWKLQFRRLLL